MTVKKGILCRLIHNEIKSNVIVREGPKFLVGNIGKPFKLSNMYHHSGFKLFLMLMTSCISC